MFDPARCTWQSARRAGIATLIACCWASHVFAEQTSLNSAAPVEIAIFPFELEDFSAAAEHGTSPAVSSYLDQATEEAKRQLLDSRRYLPVDTTGADLSAAKGSGLRNCGGCEAAIALALGADQALIGVVTKISMTEYIVRLQLRDARTEKVISSLTTDLRMGTSDSWPRGVRWLVKNRMLASK
jgi:hypothetical protein